MDDEAKGRDGFIPFLQRCLEYSSLNPNRDVEARGRGYKAGEREAGWLDNE